MIPSADLFLYLFVHGVPELDEWHSTQGRPVPRKRPEYPRPERPLPQIGSERAAVRAALSEAERALLDDAIAADLLIDFGIAEWFSYSKGDPDSPDGWLLLAEALPEHLEAGVPEWWDADLYSAETAGGLWRTISRAMDAHRRASRAHAEACYRIQAAPDTDPAWRAYDEDSATIQARQAAWDAAHLAAMQAKTGHPTFEAHSRAFWDGPKGRALAGRAA